MNTCVSMISMIFFSDAVLGHPGAIYYRANNVNSPAVKLQMAAANHRQSCLEKGCYCWLNRRNS